MMAFVANPHTQQLVCSSRASSVRSRPPVSVTPDIFTFADPFASLASLPMSEVEVLVSAANLREDFGGVVGGAYLLIGIGGFVSGLATATAISSQLVGIDAASRLVGASTAAVDDWKAGLALPSLDELHSACVLVSTPASARQLFLCTAPSSAACAVTCGIDEEFSDYYGEPVYLCHT